MQLDAQARQRRVQSRLHGSDRAPHRGRDVGNRKIGQVAQHDRDPLALGQPPEQLVQLITLDQRRDRIRLRHRLGRNSLDPSRALPTTAP